MLLTYSIVMLSFLYVLVLTIPSSKFIILIRKHFSCIFFVRCWPDLYDHHSYTWHDQIFDVMRLWKFVVEKSDKNSAIWGDMYDNTHWKFSNHSTKLDIAWWCCTWSKFLVEGGTNNCFLIFNHTSLWWTPFRLRYEWYATKKKSFQIYYANFIGAWLFTV